VWIPVQWKELNPSITITYGRLRQRLLGLADKGLTTVVACAAGYRAEADKYAGLAKVRFLKSEVLETV
jgi:hypothetical protein